MTEATEKQKAFLRKLSGKDWPDITLDDAKKKIDELLKARDEKKESPEKAQTATASPTVAKEAIEEKKPPYEPRRGNDSPDTRASIETQTIWNGIVQLQLGDKCPPGLFDAACRWALGHFILTPGEAIKEINKPTETVSPTGVLLVTKEQLAILKEFNRTNAEGLVRKLNEYKWPGVISKLTSIQADRLIKELGTN